MTRVGVRTATRAWFIHDGSAGFHPYEAVSDIIEPSYEMNRLITGLLRCTTVPSGGGKPGGPWRILSSPTSRKWWNDNEDLSLLKGTVKQWKYHNSCEAVVAKSASQPKTYFKHLKHKAPLGPWYESWYWSTALLVLFFSLIQPPSFIKFYLVYIIASVVK